LKQLTWAFGDPGLPKEKKRKFLIVVNPFGGRKLGKKIYQTKVWPFFKVANVEIEMIRKGKKKTCN